jgi:hypothetical protein
MMEAARTSETSVDNYFTRQDIPEDILNEVQQDQPVKKSRESECEWLQEPGM